VLRPYDGAFRVLLHEGDERALTLGAGKRLTGGCDVAVRIQSIAFEEGKARLLLENLGLPKVGERGVECKRLEPVVRLVLTGFPSGPPTPEVAARLDEVLATPEAYLKAKGTPFDRPPGEAPSEVASQLTDANDGERRLARGVVAWPRLLLSVAPTYRGPSKQVRYEGLVALEAVVGTDGRLHRPQIKTSLGPAHEARVKSALALWRFEPARRVEAPVGARIPLEVVFRVY
jgi:hypothetical protein